MVIYNVHYNADALVVKSLHHLLKLVDPYLAVIGVGGVGAFGSVVVHGIVAPVEQCRVGAGFVNAGIVIYRQQVNVSNAQVCKVINACRMYTVVVDGGACFGKCQELALVLHTGVGGYGEVTDMYLPDHGIRLVWAAHTLVVFPACGVGAVQVNDHSSHAVYAGGTGIDVNGLIGFGAVGDKVGVVGVFEVTLDGDGPYALCSLGHCLCLDDGSPCLGVAAGGVALDLYRISGRCPDLEGGGRLGVGCAQVVAAVGILIQCRHLGIGDSACLQ